MFEKIVKIHGENGLYLARILLDYDDVQWLKKFSKIVEENNLWCVKKFDYTPTYFTNYEGFDWDGFFGEKTIEWKGRVDLVCLQVTKDTFRWDGVIKHTNIRWSTDPIEIKELP